MVDDQAKIDLAQLVAEHHQAVYRYAYRLSGSAPDAEDLTQQVFLTAQQKLGQLRHAERVRHWLFAILRNCFVKSCHKKRPVLAGDLAMSIEAIPADAPPAEWIDQQQLQQALDELPPAYRVVLIMFYFEQCTYREIARELDLPIGTVMSRLARAKGHLRLRLFGSKGEAGSGRPSRVASLGG